jgi:D-3-phosphoglycerate dehydrogenase / 2-oxoglutarate reductase
VDLVVLLDSDFDDVELEAGLTRSRGLELVQLIDLQPEQRASVRGLLVQWATVDDSVLASFPGLRVVGRFGVGVDNIDVAAARHRGIRVVASGDYSTEEVAIHAITMMLSLDRGIRRADASVRAGSWLDFSGWREWRRPSQTVVGVVGMGRIGARVAAHLQALGFKVQVFEQNGTVPGFDNTPTLEDLLRSSQIVSLHVPLTDQTRNLLSKKRLELLPKGAALVNVARGGLVDEVALIEQLRTGHLRGAALDVFQSEPVPHSHPLCELESVILTPHLAYYSVEALLDARTRTTEGVLDVIQGVEPRYPAD